MTTPTHSDNPLNERARQLLRVLVESYIRDGQPVGSRTLARTAGLDLSPASIRNVMADLEELGLVVSPHTSAGRVPTAQGYRMFVDSLLKVRPLPEDEMARLKAGLSPEQTPRHLAEQASTLLSGVTQLAGVVMLPRQEYAPLQQVEFLKLSDRRVLAILVMAKNEIQNRILHLDRDYSAEELHQAANYLSAQFAGRDLRAVRTQILADLRDVREDMDRLMRAAIELGEKALSPSESEDVVVAGQTRLMDYDELSSVERLRQLFEAFNEKRDILHLLDKCVFSQGVQIFIGQESGYRVLDACSVVTAPYAVDGQVVGVLGVIGPTRMAYDRVIPIVDVTARLMGAALNAQP
ncbi:MAG: heat-inducible transcriptional repressor HrcA [Chromatiales bacterium]|jgi:heat-inducible transcriptional repressor|nr:heat-inducible transcriptional repressor HrcA [Chromatiales bacterium]MDX9766343.1 heat-inducible transcriptional repressor HrcA [Ectothiorhodospiraceae bacterium]